MINKNEELLNWLDKEGELHNFLCEVVWARRKGNDEHLLIFRNKKINKPISKIQCIGDGFLWLKSVDGFDFWHEKFLSFKVRKV